MAHPIRTRLRPGPVGSTRILAGIFSCRASTWLMRPTWVPWLGGESLVFFRPVFNIADASITTGVLTLVIFQRKLLGKH